VLPRRNEKDLVDVPEDVKGKLEIQLVDTIDEALEYTLTSARTSGQAPPSI
jgi:ATP-dependent Lon protease